jgi:hypothetical protein
MGNQQDSEVGDDLHVEVSDLRLDTDSRSAPTTHSPLDPGQKPGQRLIQLAITVGAACLALFVILGSFPALRDGAIGLIPGLRTTPTPTLTPGDDTFYLLPNPPGVTVSLDGHALARVPAPGDAHPLRLTRGRHLLTWRSSLFPFRPLDCRVSVPSHPGDTCPFVTGVSVSSVVTDVGRVIGLHDSLAALDSGDVTQLLATIQQALDDASSTAIVQPGESYFYYQPGQVGGPVTARQPLRATLTYQVDNAGGYSEPCILGGPYIPCRFPGQDCSRICTVAQPPASITDTPDEWLASALVNASWTYTTLDGHVVADQIGESFGVQVAVLRISWDGSSWHVSPIFGHTPGLDAADDAVCDPARAWLGQTTWSFILDDPPPDARVQQASDATPTDGCVVVLSQAPAAGKPAIFLERFGVLLTVNDVAHNPSDNLPVADSAEQRLAAQLLAELQT